MRDILSGATIPAPRDALPMDPWQIRVLRATSATPSVGAAP
jgi:hypothetical protein